MRLAFTWQAMMAVKIVPARVKSYVRRAALTTGWSERIDRAYRSRVQWQRDACVRMRLDSCTLYRLGVYL